MILQKSILTPENFFSQGILAKNINSQVPETIIFQTQNYLASLVQDLWQCTVESWPTGAFFKGFGLALKGFVTNNTILTTFFMINLCFVFPLSFQTY